MSHIYRDFIQPGRLEITLAQPSAASTTSDVAALIQNGEGGREPAARVGETDHVGLNGGHGRPAPTEGLAQAGNESLGLRTTLYPRTNRTERM